MQHEAPSLFRRDTWLQYFFCSQLFTELFSATFLHNYIYTIRTSIAVSFLINLRLPRWSIARTYNYTKLREHYCMYHALGKDAVEKSYRTPLRLRDYYLYREIAFRFGIHCQRSNLPLHSSSISSPQDNTRITPSSFRYGTIVPLNNAGLQLLLLMYKSNRLRSWT